MIQVHAYTSPTLVLLAFNWEVGGARKDFLGFSIERTPGFRYEAPTTHFARSEGLP